MRKILESKRAYRQALASHPIAEKLRMLDELRQRTLAIRRAARGSTRRQMRSWQVWPPIIT